MSSRAALAKLENLLGPNQARELSEQVLRQIGATDLRSPDDRLRFGEALIAYGGLLESIGRSIKVQAILHGAREGAPRAAMIRAVEAPIPQSGPRSSRFPSPCSGGGRLPEILPDSSAKSGT